MVYLKIVGEIDICRKRSKFLDSNNEWLKAVFVKKFAIKEDD